MHFKPLRLNTEATETGLKELSLLSLSKGCAKLQIACKTDLHWAENVQPRKVERVPTIRGSTFFRRDDSISQFDCWKFFRLDIFPPRKTQGILKIWLFLLPGNHGKLRSMIYIFLRRYIQAKAKGQCRRAAFTLHNLFVSACADFRQVLECKIVWLVTCELRQEACSCEKACWLAIRVRTRACKRGASVFHSK